MKNDKLKYNNGKLTYIQRRFLGVMGKNGDFKEYKKQQRAFSEFLERERSDYGIQKVSGAEKKEA